MVCRHSGLERRPSDMSSRNLMWQGDVCVMISVCDHKFCLMRGGGHPGECHTPAVCICCGACDILSVIPRTQVAFQRDEYHFVAMIITKWSTPLKMFFEQMQFIYCWCSTMKSWRAIPVCPRQRLYLGAPTTKIELHIFFFQSRIGIS